MTSNKKIGLIISNRNFGGQESRYLKIGYALFQRGEKVFVFVNQHLYDQIEIKYPNIWNDKNFMKNVINVKLTKSSKVQSALHLLLFHLFKLDPFFIAVKKSILSIEPDIIISNKDLINLKTLRRYYKKVLIKDYSSPENVDRSFKRKDYKRFKIADKFFFVSSSVRKRFESLFKKHLQNLGDRSQLNTFEIPFHDSQSKNVDFQNKTNKIVFAHRFMTRKNPVLFAEVIRAACNDQNFDDWSFGFYGRGPLEMELKKILEVPIKNGRVEFGFTRLLEEKLLKSKIFVSLIEPDNFPSQSVIEAMSCGNALLILNSGDSKKFIDHNGILVEKEVSKILEKLKELINKDHTAMGKNSISLARERFSKEEYISNWIDNLQKQQL